MTKGMKTNQEASGEDQPKDEKGLIILTKVLVGNMTQAGIKKEVCEYCWTLWCRMIKTLVHSHGAGIIGQKTAFESQVPLFPWTRLIVSLNPSLIL